MSRHAPRPGRRPLGQAAVDYLLVVALVALALGTGAQDPLRQLVAAIAERYSRFTWAIALP
jgi:Flp pilus assembly pilin Flp